MCYNFATFVLYLDVITLIYRENRLTSSETTLSNKGGGMGYPFMKSYSFGLSITL